VETFSPRRSNRRGFFYGTPPVDDAADQLRALALRVRHNLPGRHDPEKFHIEKSEIERTLLRIAAKFDGRNRPSAKSQRAVVTTEVIAGRRVIVQRPRMPFAIFIGGKA
jgi:hypothetical protein